MKCLITVFFLLPLIAAQTQIGYCESLQECATDYVEALSQNPSDLAMVCAAASDFYDCALLYVDQCTTTDVRTYIEQSKLTLEQFCASPPEECAEAAANSVGERQVCSVFGDPHIKTFSGLDYTNSALTQHIYEDEFLKITSVNVRPEPSSDVSILSKVLFKYKLTCIGYNGELTPGKYGTGAHQIVVEETMEGNKHLRFKGINVDVIYTGTSLHISSPFFSKAKGDCVAPPNSNDTVLSDEERDILFDSLPTEDKILATETCTEDLDDTFKSGCRLDVGVTKNVTFAQQAKHAQAARASVVAMGNGLPAEPSSSDASLRELTYFLLVGSALLLQ